MNLIFLDFDGVVTSMHETPGSYVNHLQSEYGCSKTCLDLLIDLCSSTDSKVVISSNWRRFPDDGKWRHRKGISDDLIDHKCSDWYYNPLNSLKKALGNFYYDTLPITRHLTKPKALVQWFEIHEDFRGNYVIFDDDIRENFQNENQYGIKNHFVMTNYEHGLTRKDIEKAKEILKNEDFCN